jgi:isopropylmalate/homocitrate/citramalate synthase
MKIYEDNSEFPSFNGEFKIKNWAHPELHETMLPHDSVPRLSLHNESVPLNPSKDALILDLSLTEGQLWKQLDEDEILHYYDLLRKLSGSRGVIRFTEVPGDENLILRMMEKNYQFPELIARVDPSSKLENYPVEILAANFAGSDFTLQALSHSSREDEAKAMKTFIQKCADAGKMPVLRLQDVSRAALNPYLLPLFESFLKLANEKQIPVRVRLVDSLGLWSPHPNAGFPRGLPRLLHTLINICGYPGEWLSVEAANDMGMAPAVVQSAWLYGAGVAAVTLGGRGQRSGLASLESALAELLAIRSDSPRINLALTRDLENLVTASGKVPKLGKNVPYLGNATFQERRCDSENIANAYDPSLVWGGQVSRLLSPDSSRQDLVTWLKDQLGRGVVLTPEHPGVVKMIDWVNSSNEDPLDNNEVLRQARRFLPGFFVMEGFND